jgi:hypothetical protein
MTEVAAPVVATAQSAAAAPSHLAFALLRRREPLTLITRRGVAVLAVILALRGPVAIATDLAANCR